MAIINLEQLELLYDYQIFEKYFKGTALENCAEYTFDGDSLSLFSGIESSNHSQLLIQRLLIGSNPTCFKDLFDFFCKNVYLEIKPCCDFQANTKGEIYLYFIGHNDNRSLFGENASMMFNFVATLTLSRIDHENRSIGFNLSFKEHLPLERDFEELSLTQKVKIHTLKRIIKFNAPEIYPTIDAMISFMERHHFEINKNEEILQLALKSHAQQLGSDHLPVEFTIPTIRYLTHSMIIDLFQSQSVSTVVQWIKSNVFELQFNFDLEFYSRKLGITVNAEELFEIIREYVESDFINLEWFVLIHPLPSKAQVDSQLNIVQI